MGGVLSKTKAKQITEMAKADSRGALRELAAHVAVKAGVHRAKQFSIDAIARTKKRRTPKQHTGSYDQEFRSDHERISLIATVRDLVMNSAMGKGLVRQHIKNVIGVGPKLQMRTKDAEYNERAEAYFNRRKNLVDVRGMSFAASLRVGEEREVEDGDYLVMIVTGGRTQHIEADRIQNPPGKRNSKNRSFIGGVEVNSEGLPVAYHIWNRTRTPGRMTYWKRVPAENVWHQFRPERYDQARGSTWLMAAVNDMQDLRETLEAVKGKMKIENRLGVAITSDLPEADGISTLWGGLTGYNVTDGDGANEERYQVKLDEGVHSFELRPGEKVQTISSTTPNTTFEPMTILLIRMIGLVLEMPLEIALQYFTRGSYSATRAAFGQYYDSVLMRRSEIEENRLDKEVNWMLQRAINRKSLEGPKEGIDPTDHRWQWPGLTTIDPDKRRKGDTLAYKLRAESLTKITGRDGNDFQDIGREIIQELKFLRDEALKEGIPEEWITSYVLPIVNDPGQLGETAQTEDEQPDEEDDADE